MFIHYNLSGNKWMLYKCGLSKLHSVVFDLHFYANMYDKMLILSNHISPEKALNKSSSSHLVLFRHCFKTHTTHLIFITRSVHNNNGSTICFM